MQYKEFGKTGLKVSEVGFGAWAIGGKGWGNDVQDHHSMEALAKAWETGMNLFDTADAYGDGHSEKLIGEFLKGKRGEAVIVTKGGTNFRLPERSKNFTHDYLMMCLDESLQRLQTDYVDVYLLHVPSAQWQDEEHVLCTMQEMKASGKARFVGLAMWGAADSLHALKNDTDGVIDVLEVPFNILNKSNHEVVNIARERGIAVMTSEPLCSGVLTGKYQTGTTFADCDHRKGFWSAQRWEDLENSLKTIEACAAQAGMSMTELALAYNLSWPGISCVIPGGKTAQQVEKNAAAAGLRISEDMRLKLDQVPGFVY